MVPHGLQSSRDLHAIICCGSISAAGFKFCFTARKSPATWAGIRKAATVAVNRDVWRPLRSRMPLSPWPFRLPSHLAINRQCSLRWIIATPVFETHRLSPLLEIPFALRSHFTTFSFENQLPNHFHQSGTCQKPFMALTTARPLHNRNSQQSRRVATASQGNPEATSLVRVISGPGDSPWGGDCSF